MKYFVAFFSFVFHFSVSAQTFNYGTGRVDVGDEIMGVPASYSPLKTAGIPCNPGTFWANNNAGSIVEYTIMGGAIYSTGISYSSGNTNSLLYANNLAGTSFGPTFYSPSGKYLSYFDGASWNVFDSITYSLINGGGHGNDLYMMNTGIGIIHYDQNGFDTIYTIPPGSLMPVADVAVDDAGNIYFIEKATFGDSLVIMSPSGIIVKKLPITISNYYNAYGCFLMNGTFYIGFGGASPVYPSSLLPIIINSNSATLGNPIPFPSSSVFIDLECCDPGLPLGGTANIQSSDTTFCDKQYIDFYDLSTNNPTSWQWLFPGGNPSSSTQQNPTGIFYNSYGSFDVTLIACNAVGCDTLYLSNFINELSNPPVPTITWIADTLFSSLAYSYQWYDATGIIPGATGPYYVFPQPGNYYVVVTDSNGCAVASFVIYTGIDEAVGNLGGISIVPNPSNGNFVLSGAPIHATLKIYDVAGRVVYSDKIHASPELLQIKSTDGVYFLEITGNKFIYRKKIVINN